LADAGSYFLIAEADGQRYPLVTGVTKVGRADDNDVVLPDNPVSRRHCQLVVRDSGDCEVEDSSSRHGTRVNGHRVTRATLTPGDVLQLCDRRFLIVRVSADGKQTPDVPFHPPFNDDVLGRVIWNVENCCWTFDAGPVNGRPVQAMYTPANDRLSPAEHGWDRVRACVQWVRANEGVVRSYVEQTFPAHSPLYRQRNLSDTIFFADQEARLIYYDLLGAISVHINAAGQFIGPPAWIRDRRDTDDED
jgi:hypothetical protein